MFRTCLRIFKIFIIIFKIFIRIFRIFIRIFGKNIWNIYKNISNIYKNISHPLKVYKFSMLGFHKCTTPAFLKPLKFVGCAQVGESQSLTAVSNLRAQRM